MFYIPFHFHIIETCPCFLQSTSPEHVFRTEYFGVANNHDKTTELTQLQVGEKSDTVRLVVSTISEAEQLKPYLEECKENGRSIDVRLST